MLHPVAPLGRSSRPAPGFGPRGRVPCRRVLRWFGRVCSGVSRLLAEKNGFRGDSLPSKTVFASVGFRSGIAGAYARDRRPVAAVAAALYGGPDRADHRCVLASAVRWRSLCSGGGAGGRVAESLFGVRRRRQGGGFLCSGGGAGGGGARPSPPSSNDAGGPYGPSGRRFVFCGGCPRGVRVSVADPRAPSARKPPAPAAASCRCRGSV